MGTKLKPTLALLLSALLVASGVPASAEEPSSLLSGAKERAAAVESRLSSFLSDLTGADVSLSGSLQVGVDALEDALAGAQAAIAEVDVEALLQRLRDAGADTVEELTSALNAFFEEKVFTDRPFTESLPDLLGVDASRGEALSAFLTDFFGTEIATGRDLQAVLPGWLEEQGIVLRMMAEDVAQTVVGATAVSLVLLFSAADRVASGEIPQEELRQDLDAMAEELASGVRELAGQLLSGERQIDFDLSAAMSSYRESLLHRYAESLPGRTVDGVTYRTGFYDEACGFRPEICGEAFELDGQTYYHVNGAPFPMIFLRRAATAYTLSGTLYCADENWEAARDYYADGANYNYFCQVGAQYVDRDPEFRPLPEMDGALFDRLMDFAAANAYNPFGANRSAQLLHLPIPDRDAAPELTFYRESADGCIVSYGGYHFRSVDGQLLMVYYYDFGHGEYQEMVAAPVPEDLAAPVLACLQGD